VLLLVPLGAIGVLRIVEVDLVDGTERRLIAEGVTLSEAYRDALRRAEGLPPADPVAPPWADDDRYWPIEPVVDPRRPLAPQEVAASRTVPLDARGGATWSAGEAIGPLLRRAQRANLSGVRVLDADGCVVASSGGQIGECLDHLPEVAGALQGRYAAVGRARVSDEPTPPLTSIRRRGTTRLFAAVPVLRDGEVIAVVRVSRTARDPREAAWEHRGSLLLGLLACLALTGLTSRFLTRRIVGPVRELTVAAGRVADARPGTAARLPPPARAPAEVQNLADALDTMTARLARHATDAADFAAATSHELKTPLAGIRGAVELLRDSWEAMTEAQRERFLANIDADAERMQRLSTRLLRLARIEASAPADSADANLREVLEALCERAGGRVRLTVDPDAPERVGVGREDLEASVGNLVDNALQHGGDGPVEVTAGRGEDGRITIAVRDHGPGISPAVRARIFDPFFTTGRDDGGTGLGLAIVAAVADLRGGRVECESGPEGTVFRLIL